MLYIISDLHWGEPAIEHMFYAQDFSGSVEAYEVYTRRRWLQKVKEQDTVLIVGDAGVPLLYQDMPGTKILVKGNHDTYPENGYSVFDKVILKGISTFCDMSVSFSHKFEDSIKEYDIYVLGHYHQMDSYMYVYEDKTRFYVLPNLLGYEPRSFSELCTSKYNLWRYEFLESWNSII